MDLERTQVQSPEDRVKSQDLSLRRTQPPAKVPGYEPDHLLGEGAYGEVWVAIERNTGRKVAVKFYTRRGGMDWTLLKREVEKLATLAADRYVIQLIEVGWESDPPYYVMEYLGHGSLEERLEDEGTLSVDESIAMFREVATGLMHAHGKSVLHCDLKPANVLLDQDSKPRLCDFGQARLSDEQTPSLGTLFYMAPEQAHLKEAVPDVRWDVYALGALFYCMLTGEPPYRTDETIKKLEAAEGLEERLAAYRELFEESPRPAEHRKVPGVERQLADIIDRCLAPQPSKRYSNVQAVLNDLEDWQQRKARRPQLVLGTVLPVLLLLVVGIFAVQGFRSAVETTETELNNGTDNLLKTIAHFAVGTIENRINKRWGFLIVEATELTKPSGSGRDTTPEDPESSPSSPPVAKKDTRRRLRPKSIYEATEALKALLKNHGQDGEAILKKYENAYSTDFQVFHAMVEEAASRYHNARKTQADRGGAHFTKADARREIEEMLQIVVLEGARKFLSEYRDATKAMPLLAELSQGGANVPVAAIEGEFRKDLVKANPQQETLLFRVPPDPQDQLDVAQISDSLRKRFEGQNMTLPEKVAVCVVEAGREWSVDADKRRYFVRKSADGLGVYKSYRYNDRYEGLAPDEVVRLYGVHLEMLERLANVAKGAETKQRIDRTRGLETLDAAKWWTLANVAQQLSRADEQGWGRLPAKEKAEAVNERFKQKISENPGAFLEFAAAVDAQLGKMDSSVINAWRWLPHWLTIVRKAYDQDDPDVQSASWFLNNAQGIQLARTPMRHTLFDEWSWRDYFHGQRRDTQMKRHADGKRVAEPIAVPHLSQPFDSQATGLPIVAFSVPLKTPVPLSVVKKAADAPATVAGILAMTVNFGEFSELGHESEKEGVDTTLVDARPHATPGPNGEPRPGVLLEHRHLKPQKSEGDQEQPRKADAKKYFLGKQAVAVVTNLIRATQNAESTPTLRDYYDPVGKDLKDYAGPWRAAFKAVVVRNRHTGWVVIVQRKQEKVLAPVKKLEEELRGQAILAAILIVVVLVAAWGFVILILHGQTRSKFVTTLRRRLKLTVSGGTGSAGNTPRTQRRTSRLTARRENGKS